MFRGFYYGIGSGPIWLNYLLCIGNEMSLAECGHSGWGVRDCDDRRDVSIACGYCKYTTIVTILITHFCFCEHDTKMTEAKILILLFIGRIRE